MTTRRMNIAFGVAGTKAVTVRLVSNPVQTRKSIEWTLSSDFLIDMDDLNTGKTPVAPSASLKRGSSHQSGLSVHMAKAVPTLGSSLTPAQYRTRKVALITGALAARRRA